MKKERLIFNKLNISSKLSYALIALFVLAIIGVGVYAVAGAVPNPGHALSEVQPCSQGEILMASGGVWTCAAAGVIFPDIHDVSGNVGIGTGSPGAKLDVVGSVKASSICINGDCKSSWPQTSSMTVIPTTSVGDMVGYASQVISGTNYALPIYQILVGVDRVDTRTETPDHLYLSTYDDFRYGPSSMCQKFGYPQGSNGKYSCKDMITNTCQVAYGTETDYTPQVDYRTNGNWGKTSAGQCGGYGTIAGENWCAGNKYIEWVECLK